MRSTLPKMRIQSPKKNNKINRVLVFCAQTESCLQVACMFDKKRIRYSLLDFEKQRKEVPTHETRKKTLSEQDLLQPIEVLMKSLETEPSEREQIEAKLHEHEQVQVKRAEENKVAVLHSHKQQRVSLLIQTHPHCPPPPPNLPTLPRIKNTHMNFPCSTFPYLQLSPISFLYHHHSQPHTFHHNITHSTFTSRNPTHYCRGCGKKRNIS